MHRHGVLALVLAGCAIVAGCGQRDPLRSQAGTAGASQVDAGAAGTSGGAGTAFPMMVSPDGAAGTATPDASDPGVVDAGPAPHEDAGVAVHGWVNRTPSVLPADWPVGRRQPAVVYDRRSKRVIVHGGISGGQPVQDTWAWDGATGHWTRLPVKPPSAFVMSGATWDDTSGSVMLFGGQTDLNAAPLNGLWSFAVEWTLVAPSATGAPWPPAQLNPRLAYDAARARVVLLGSGASPSTWEWDGGAHAWSERVASGSPTNNTGAFAWDERRHVGVFFGDQQWGETWEWDGVAGTWTRKTFPVDKSPAPRNLSAAAYDSDAGRVVVFGGSPIDSPGTNTWTNDLWEWDGTSWTLLDFSHAGARPDIEAHGLAYDSDRHCLVTFGGDTPYSEPEELWEWHR